MRFVRKNKNGRDFFLRDFFSRELFFRENLIFAKFSRLLFLHIFFTLFKRLQKMSGNVDCFIRLPSGQECPFYIEKRCPLSKLVSNTREQLGYDITSVELEKRPSMVRNPLKGLDLYLIEDHKVGRNDCIILTGTKVAQGEGIVDAIDVYADVQYEGKDAPQPFTVLISVRFNSPVQKIIDLLARQLDMVPGTLKLYTKDGKLMNTTQKVSQYLKLNDHFDLRGSWFPISLLGPSFQFAENVGMVSSTECVICLEKKVDGKVFGCGHANVCSACSRDMSEERCPLCK